MNVRRPQDTVPHASELIRRALALQPVLAARAGEADQARRLPEATIAAVREAGLFRIVQPKRWGGYEMDVGVLFDVQRTLSAGDMSAGWVCGLLAMHPCQLALFRDPAAHGVWSDDPETLICSSLMPTGEATMVEGGVRLSGRWKYASGCDHAGWAFLGAAVKDDPQPPHLNRTMFLVPRAELEIVDTWDVVGLRGTGSHDIVVKNAFVPAHRTQPFVNGFRATGAGQAVNTAPLYRLPFGQIFSRGVSTPCLGALQAMLAAFRAYGSGRASLGVRTAEDPVAQLVTAEAAPALDEMPATLHPTFAP